MTAAEEGEEEEEAHLQLPPCTSWNQGLTHRNDIYITNSTVITVRLEITNILR